MKAALSSRVAAGALVLVLIVGSCSTSASIERRDGPPTDGRIVRSDGDAIYLGDHEGRIMRIDRRQVADIDHPGNVVLTVGGILTTVLLFALFGVLAEEPERVNVPIAAGVITPPLALSVGSGYLYFRSKNAAKAFEEAPTYVRVGPKRTVFEAEDFRMPLPARPDGGADGGP